MTLLLVTTPPQRPAVRALAAQLDFNVGTDIWKAEVHNHTVSVRGGFEFFQLKMADKRLPGCEFRAFIIIILDELAFFKYAI